MWIKLQDPDQTLVNLSEFSSIYGSDDYIYFRYAHRSDLNYQVFYPLHLENKRKEDMQRIEEMLIPPPTTFGSFNWGNYTPCSPVWTPQEEKDNVSSETRIKGTEEV